MAPTDPSGNQLFSMLPAPVIERIGARAAVVPMAADELLIDAGEPIGALYFPLDGVVSLDQPIVSGDEESLAPSIAFIGNEGFVGVEPILGSEPAISRARVRIQGHALRIDAQAVQEEFGRAGALHRLLLRATDALFGQVSANAVCERIHPVQQRLVRWLLLTHDRAPQGDLGLTQDTLSQVLGVRRASVSTAASRLQAAGLIDYRRGRIMILDRARLEGLSCQCYREIKTRYASHLS